LETLAHGQLLLAFVERPAYKGETLVPQPPALGFGRKEISDRGRIYAWNSSLWKWGDGGTAVALIPFCPGTLVENTRCGVIQRGLEVVVTEVLPEDFNILTRGVRHRVRKKTQWEFQGFFWSAKPEDPLGDR
jgi:hypothetical protein